MTWTVRGTAKLVLASILLIGWACLHICVCLRYIAKQVLVMVAIGAFLFFLIF